MSIVARVHRIPEGCVAAFSDLCPTAPRHAGAVLRALPAGSDAPWWRVVRADGTVPQGDRQRARLRGEGVPFRGDRVDVGDARVPPEALD